MFTEARTAFMLKQGQQGTPVAELCRKAGSSQATYCSWKKIYGGLLPGEMRWLNANWFMSLADLLESLEYWCRYYYKERPHNAIGYNVPIAMHFPNGVISPSS